MAEFCNRYSDSFHRWWDDLGEVELTPDVAGKLVDGAKQAMHGKTLEETAGDRDALIVAMLKATKDLRG